MPDVVQIRFPAMGCPIQVIVGQPLAAGTPAPAKAAAAARAYLEDFDARLSRFRADSELSRLNADPREEVPASPLLRAAVSAGLWAAERSGGLVDPTVIDALERNGYAGSRARTLPEPLGEALAAAPPRRAAAASATSRWREIEVDDAAGVIRRPPGVRFDTGGSGKGLAADAVAHRLRAYERSIVDCAGDVRLNGPGFARTPMHVTLRHPLTGRALTPLAPRGGAVATSGIDSRVWRRDDGSYAHHLIDPATGEPAWTGLVAATAVAPTALEAETLTKMALLLGPDGAREVLAEHGGIAYGDDGGVELIGPVAPLQARAAKQQARQRARRPKMQVRLPR